MYRLGNLSSRTRAVSKLASFRRTRWFPARPAHSVVSLPTKRTAIDKKHPNLLLQREYGRQVNRADGFAVARHGARNQNYLGLRRVMADFGSNHPVLLSGLVFDSVERQNCGLGGQLYTDRANCVAALQRCIGCRFTEGRIFAAAEAGGSQAVPSPNTTLAISAISPSFFLKPRRFCSCGGSHSSRDAL